MPQQLLGLSLCNENLKQLLLNVLPCVFAAIECISTFADEVGFAETDCYGEVTTKRRHSRGTPLSS